MKIRSYLALTFFIFFATPFFTFAQFERGKVKFTHADSLRGSLTTLRTCYDINYYHLDVKFDIDQKHIKGSNLFKFTAAQDFDQLQFDLFANLNIDKITYRKKELPFKRDGDAVFITFPGLIKKGAQDEFTVFYSGYPIVTKKAPMLGGIVFSTDSMGKPFVATACEGTGASVWWPNKDHLYDEVDSMLISISVPSHLKNVSNGRLRKVTNLKNGYTRFDWFVGSPINNYNVAANIGDYTNISDSYRGEGGELTLDYWVLSHNVEKAKLQFKENVKSMLSSYEYWAGPYPFYKDGYKLVEVPYPAMEHQSAIAYGGFLKGFPPNEFVGVEGGTKWDFIILHESAHEWFGNSITTKDLGDLWIHEGFGTYLTYLFVESQYGKDAAQKAIFLTRPGISNDSQVAGPYNVNQMGSGDMYSKGAVLLNMVRLVINDDEKWRSILRGLNTKFYHKTVDYSDVVSYISKESDRNFNSIFDQFLKYKSLPVLEFIEKDGKLNCRWVAEAKDFNMPVPVRIIGGNYKLIYPSSNFSVIDIAGISKGNIEVDI
ncbi:M1 family metallopeptidase [Pedobacter sp. MC2016-15]|uniref:M1 family metallopeptidase n=1 Tax=Pedobacter sp. MC2016-15 TaxID=2994473 RepID=UPI002247E226|nr:M1 family metallopeptidase [Pedobacter sp. MC2016-15]MCX2480966.1 M1 family metallopeptidase [Pedobacter sp. MC2016-15]